MLDELCRFEIVDKHRSAFAWNYSINRAALVFCLTLLLTTSLFNMLGMHPMKDSGAELSRELKQVLVHLPFVVVLWVCGCVCVCSK